MAKRFYEQVMGVYFDDLDSYRILHNARYFLLFERTLGQFWQEVGFGVLQSSKAPEHFHYVRANSIEYLSPVYGVGRVRVRVWIEKLGRTSLTFGFCLMPLHEDRQHAVGERTVVCVDPDNQRPKPWGEDFRKQLEPWIN
jgi:acyl-CoA thioester hydrolase